MSVTLPNPKAGGHVSNVTPLRPKAMLVTLTYCKAEGQVRYVVPEYVVPEVRSTGGT